MLKFFFSRKSTEKGGGRGNYCHVTAISEKCHTVMSTRGTTPFCKQLLPPIDNPTPQKTSLPPNRRCIRHPTPLHHSNTLVIHCISQTHSIQLCHNLRIMFPSHICPTIQIRSFANMQQIIKAIEQCSEFRGCGICREYHDIACQGLSIE